ncbi:15362_t:CDS:2 [Dentiscutata heterogama]|uniref:15362_t:CDS:1 n=1 Tax=Dentiscutata heterogama TaxID=1316150 RepID=A0ACA9LMX3_9GLOM|nr:15362_t:CDS:2 [Dentiscutata heterogama]
MSVFRNLEDKFQLPKGWALPRNTRFGKKGVKNKIKIKVVSILKQPFLNSNLNPKDKLMAKEMYEELLRFAHSLTQSKTGLDDTQENLTRKKQSLSLKLLKQQALHQIPKIRVREN